MRKEIITWALAVCLALVSTAGAGEFRDRNQALFGSDSGAFENVTLLALASSAAYIVGTVGLVGNLIHDIHGEYPGGKWIVIGYTGVATNLAIGLIYLASDRSEKEVFLGLGLSHIALASLDLGLTIWAHTQPRAGVDMALSIGPSSIVDVAGHPAPGLNLRLVTW